MVEKEWTAPLGAEATRAFLFPALLSGVSSLFASQQLVAGDSCVTATIMTDTETNNRNTLLMSDLHLLCSETGRPFYYLTQVTCSWLIQQQHTHRSKRAHYSKPSNHSEFPAADSG